MKITRGVPIPAKRPRKATYPFQNLEVGDSFTVPATDKPKTAALLSNRAVWWGRRLSRSFTVRQTDAGVGVWRTK